MFRANLTRARCAGLILSALLLVGPTQAAGQHHGGHGMGAGAPGGAGRPDGVDEKDTLKDFHQALAVQATSEQISEFQEVVKTAGAAKERLAAFAQGETRREGIGPVDQALAEARSKNKKFQDGFSPSQKSGLKEITKRLEKADSDLDQEARRLDQAVQSESGAPQISTQASSLGKALTEFSNVELSLGREMGITLASGQDLSFNIPQVRNSVHLGSRTFSLDSSGVLSQIAAQGDQRSFSLAMALDLSDLQQSITEILSDKISEAKSCGARLVVRHATLVAAAPASSLILQLHFERWSCSPIAGQSVSAELGEGEGSIELKLTPSVEKSNVLKINAEIKRIDASGMMGEELRSGDLGSDLRDKVAQSILSALQTGSDFKATMPPVVQSGVSLQGARFEDSGAGGLKVLLAGQVQLSNAQVDQLAMQLNQSLSAKAPPQ
jgi:hypothetical protein